MVGRKKKSTRIEKERPSVFGKGAIKIRKENSQKFRSFEGIKYVPPHEKLIWVLILAGLSNDRIEEDLFFMEYPVLPHEYYNDIRKKFKKDPMTQGIVEYNADILKEKSDEKPRMPKDAHLLFHGKYYEEHIYLIHGKTQPQADYKMQHGKIISTVMINQEARQFLECAALQTMTLSQIKRAWNDEYQTKGLEVTKLTQNAMAVYYSYYWQYTASKLASRGITDKDILLYMQDVSNGDGKAYYTPHILLLGKTIDHFNTYFGIGDQETRKRINKKLLGQIKVRLCRSISSGTTFTPAEIDMLKYLDNQIIEDERAIADSHYLTLKQEIESIKGMLSLHIKPTSQSLVNPPYDPEKDGEPEEKDVPYKRSVVYADTED